MQRGPVLSNEVHQPQEWFRKHLHCTATSCSTLPVQIADIHWAALHSTVLWCNALGITELDVLHPTVQNHNSLNPCYSLECSEVRCCPMKFISLRNFIKFTWVSVQHVQCSAVQCSISKCSAVQLNAGQCSAGQYSVVQCRAVQCGAVQCSVVQCSSV